MRILQIGGTYEEGGSGTIIACIHKALIRAGAYSAVLEALTPSSDRNVMQMRKKASMFAWTLLRKLRINLSQFAPVATLKLISRIKAEQPDIIHLHVIHHGLWNYGRILAFLKKYDKPIVISMHDMWYITGGCYHFIDARCERYKTGCKACPKRRRALDCFPIETHGHWLTKKNLLSQIGSLHIVCVSQWVKDSLAGSILSQKPCAVIANAVDTDVFRPVEVRRDSARKRIIGVANFWSGEKGIDDFIALSQLISPEYEIMLVGSVAPERRNALKERGIVLCGQVDREKLASRYSEADVFVCLSHQETFGLVIAEAACCGKRTIGYDVAAIREVARAAHGIVVEEHDLDAVWRAVDSVCKNDDALRGDELRQVRAAFGTRRLVDQHLALYESIAAGKETD